MDAMVTARLPQEKKIRGNEILASLGTTPSRLIGEVYDYLIAERKLPDLSRSADRKQTESERAAMYQDFLNATVLPVPQSFWTDASHGNDASDDNDLLTSLLEEKYGPLA